jgi:hypothetical protein
MNFLRNVASILRIDDMKVELQGFSGTIALTYQDVRCHRVDNRGFDTAMLSSNLLCGNIKIPMEIKEALFTAIFVNHNVTTS